MNPGQGWLRLLRGALLAACCLSLGVSGHALGGGFLRPNAPVLVVALLVAAGSAAWASRQRGFRQLLAAVVGAQVAFHLVLSFSPDPATATHARHVVPGPTAAADLRMLLGHLVGTVLTAWVLTRGDTALWAVYRSLGRFVVPRACFTPAIVETPLRLCAQPNAGMITGVGLLLAGATSYRGPPTVVAA